MIFERTTKMNFVFVGLGGALGAIGRYEISMISIKTEFPFLTLITNILGAVLIGFISGMVSAKQDVSQNTVLFWKTGVCGGFTTFSTFSLEAYELFEKGSTILGLVYAVVSVVSCILGIVCGKKIAEFFGG